MSSPFAFTAVRQFVEARYAQLVSLVLLGRASDASNATAGQLGYRSDTSKWRGYTSTWDNVAMEAWVTAGMAPINADYLVGTANATLTGEIVVGTSPGGELGGTWALPTVDATHSGSAHADFIAKSFFAAKGDLIGASANDTPSLLTVGADDTILMADAAQTAGLKWVALATSIEFVIDGGGSAITTGQKGHLEIPFGMTITGWSLFADQSGSIVIDVWKDTYANFPPTVADTIAGSEKPTLSTAQKNQDLSLSTWTTSVTSGDVLAFNVDSATTVTRVTLSIRGTRP